MREADSLNPGADGQRRYRGRGRRPQRETSLLLVRIHQIIVMMKWTGLAPWEFEFPFPGSLTSTFLVQMGRGDTADVDSVSDLPSASTFLDPSWPATPTTRHRFSPRIYFSLRTSLKQTSLTAGYAGSFGEILIEPPGPY